MSGMPAKRGLAVLRQIDPSAKLVAEDDGWRVLHSIIANNGQPQPSAVGPDRDSLLQRLSFVFSLAPSVTVRGQSYRWRHGSHSPGDQHWEKVWFRSED